MTSNPWSFLRFLHMAKPKSSTSENEKTGVKTVTIEGVMCVVANGPYKLWLNPMCGYKTTVHYRDHLGKNRDHKTDHNGSIWIRDHFTLGSTLDDHCVIRGFDRWTDFEKMIVDVWTSANRKQSIYNAFDNAIWEVRYEGAVIYRITPYADA
jgi:hypothetical protein